MHSVPAKISKEQGANPEKGNLTCDMIIMKRACFNKDINQSLCLFVEITGYTGTTSIAHIELYLSTF